MDDRTARLGLLLLGLVSGCGGGAGGEDAAAGDAGVRDTGVDAAASGDARVPDAFAIDAFAIDALADDAFVPDAFVCAQPLLVGGVDPSTQGWMTQMEGPATLALRTGDTELVTTTSSGARTGGVLLSYAPDVLVPGAAFHLEVELQVVATNGHNPSDAAVAVLGSFTPPYGVPAQRAQMIYLDADRIGWADDTGSFATTVTDGAFHTLGLAVDAAGNATVTWDGAAALSRTGFVTNGTIAIGDQTNEPNLDATTRVRAVTLLRCP